MGWGYLSLHFLSAGIWSGCALSEEIARKVLQGQSKEMRKALAQLQCWSDLAVALPASLLVTFSGLKLMIGRSPSKLVHAMSGIGAAALLMKMASLPFVVPRHNAALEDDWERFEENEKWARRFGRGAAHTVLLALGLSLVMSREDY